MLDYNFCCSPLVTIFRNTVLAEGTYMSDLLGIVVWNVTELESAGYLLICYTFWYHVAVYLEQLMTLILALDVLSTIKNPFDRVRNLKIYLRLYKIGIVVIFVECLSTIPYCFYKAHELAPQLRELDFEDALTIMRMKFSIDH